MSQRVLIAPDKFKGTLSAAAAASAIARGWRSVRPGDTLEIEFIQDLVETQLMEAGHHSLARRYILYREDRRKARVEIGHRITASDLFVKSV